VIQNDGFAGRKRLPHRCGIVRLDTDYLDLGIYRFDVCGYTGDQAAATDRHKHCADLLVGLFEDFHADRALASDNGRIVERVYET